MPTITLPRTPKIATLTPILAEAIERISRASLTPEEARESFEQSLARSNSADPARILQWELEKQGVSITDLAKVATFGVRGSVFE